MIPLGENFGSCSWLPQRLHPKPAAPAPKVSQRWWLMVSAVLLPQHQVNTVIRHAGGKDQARVIVPIQSIQPGCFACQEAWASLWLPVLWQRPATNQALCPQVHDVQVAVVKQQGKDISKAKQGQVCYLRCLDDPENIITSKVPLVETKCWTADNVFPIKMQSWLQADASILRDRQCL